jgi:hypothetical protein
MASRSDVLDTLRATYLEGVRIDLTAEGVPTVTDGTPSPDLLARLRTHRTDLLAIVTAQGIGTNPEDRSTPRRYVIPPDCLAANPCSRLGWCSQQWMHKACDHADAGWEAT